MSVEIHEFSGHRVAALPAEGDRVRSESDALDLVGTARSYDAGWLLLPVARLDQELFDLKNRLLGGILQKLVNYQLRLIVVGDISQHRDRSRALRDFVTESNRGSQLWFADDLAAVEKRFGEVS